MRLKTGPRIVIGVLIVAAIGYGLNIYLEGRKAKVAEPVVTAPAYDTQAQPTQAPPVVQADPTPAQPAPAPQRQTRQDKALNDLLKETK